MLGAAFLCGVLALIGALYGQAVFNLGNLITHARASSPDSYIATCQKIEASISSASQVFYPGEFQCDFEGLPLLFITVNCGYFLALNETVRTHVIRIKRVHETKAKIQASKLRFSLLSCALFSFL
jgi:hypothetical protein